MSMNGKRALILGAGRVVGPYLLRQLHSDGYRSEILSRSRPAWLDDGSSVWIPFDATRPAVWTAPPGALIVSLLPLWLLPPLLPRLGRAARLVAFSSSSALSYANSSDPDEQTLGARLRHAELQVIAGAVRAKLPYHILRPTLTYGGGTDSNLSAVLRFVDEFGFFPIAGAGRGLRQPVHAEDLAIAAIAVTRSRAAEGGVFELAGGETLRFRLMVQRTIEQSGRQARLVSLPPALLRLGFRLFGGSLREHYSPGLFARMNQDQAFSIEPARKAFGYAPRALNLRPEDFAERRLVPEQSKPVVRRLLRQI